MKLTDLGQAEEKIPVLQVLDDIYNPNGGPVSWAARDYYYINYATSEVQRQMDKEEKFQTIFAFSVTIGIVLLCVVMVISSIF